jgi:hypothetical protein
MEQIPQTYQKLPGARRTPFRQATLWLAPDHILSVDSHRFSEEYKRYYLKDIQAIIVRQTGSTAMGKAIDLVFAIFLALLALSAWRLQSRSTAIAGGLILIGFVIFKSLGRRCACQLITAVSRDKLPSLNRLATAEKALRIIEPLVQESQREPAP